MRTVIAGYHWFTDWGRDTMISLEGLTLSTGRHTEAGWILRTFAHYIRDGLIPNYFPDGKNEGRLSHRRRDALVLPRAGSLPATMTGDRATLARAAAEAAGHRRASPARHAFRHRRGSGGRPAAAGRGRLSAHLDGCESGRLGGDAAARQGGGDQCALVQRAAAAGRLARARRAATRRRSRSASTPRACRESFNQRFWYEAGGYLYDVVDGEKAATIPPAGPIRSSHLAAASGAGRSSTGSAVLETVRAKLLTPVGLRSLSRDHPDYKARYFGDLRARDAAYHQGTVWGWLIGPFIDAWLKVHPDDARARASS